MAEVDERAPPSAGKDVSPQRQMWTPRSEQRAKRRCKGQNISRKAGAQTGLRSGRERGSRSAAAKPCGGGGQRALRTRKRLQRHVALVDGRRLGSKDPSSLTRRRHRDLGRRRTERESFDDGDVRGNARRSRETRSKRPSREGGLCRRDDAEPKNGAASRATRSSEQSQSGHALLRQACRHDARLPICTRQTMQGRRGR